MRKDAKIGFAIGGVLLAVLTVYVIVVPRHRNAISPNAVTLSIPADMPAGDSSTTSTDTSNTKPQPGDALAKNTSGDGVNWERLLNGGAGPGDVAPPLIATTTTPGNGEGAVVPGTATSGNTPSTKSPVTVV